MFFSFRNWKRAVTALLMCTFIIWPLHQAQGILWCWQINVSCILCTVTSLVDGRYLIFPTVACNQANLLVRVWGSKCGAQKLVLIFLVVLEDLFVFKVMIIHSFIFITRSSRSIQDKAIRIQNLSYNVHAESAVSTT